MSDPVSNAEIEDVLSSIRQLISESKANSRTGTPDRAETLILTADFRVHDEEPSQIATSETAKGSVTSATPAKDAVPPASSMDVVDSAQNTSSETTSETDSVPVFSHRDYEQSTHASEPPPEAKKTMDRTSDLWELDGGEETAQSDVLSFHAARMHADKGSIVGENKTQEWGSKAEDAAPFVEVDVTPSPDTTPADTDERPALVAASNVEIVGEDTDIIDEEVVQEMVARLVREELQGEIGEKITQSIRRFVRQEIERAVTLKELE